MIRQKENTKCDSNNFLTDYYLTLTNSQTIFSNSMHSYKLFILWLSMTKMTHTHTHTHTSGMIWHLSEHTIKLHYVTLLPINSAVQMHTELDFQEAKSESVLIFRWDDLQWHLKGCVHGCCLGLHTFLSPFNMAF